MKDIYEEIKKIPVLDVHTHVEWKNPFAKNAWEILGYHYLTEQAHAQGMEREYALKNDKFSDRERAEKVSEYLPGMITTEPYHWLIYLLQRLFDFPYAHLDKDNLEDFWDSAAEKAKNPQRLEEIAEKSNIEIISLTNMAWEDLEGVENFKNKKGQRLFVPTYRADPLLRPDRETIRMMEKVGDKEIYSLKEYKDCVRRRLEYFLKYGTKSCAVSLEPDPVTMRVEDKEAEGIFAKIIKENIFAPSFSPGREQGEAVRFQAYMMEYLARLCQEHDLPFQLMIGVRKLFYKAGVPGGEDVSEPQGSLFHLGYLLNKFPRVTFPISILNPTQNKELAVYARIFPNVYASGHWWFENIAGDIETNLYQRLKVCPHKKLIGQYSDAYTSELIEAKIDMYKRCLAKVLTDYLEKGQLTEKQSLGIARDLLYNQPRKIFRLA